ncbi:MAG: zinc ribbon domain-containing protein [Prevotella sp.]|nr:zinc ribbon domain-containing protein [Prevotella sp.]
MQRKFLIFSLLTLLLCGCYNKKYSEGRHYSFNYNFVVKADSVELLRQQPEELASELMTDSFVVARGSHLVVADFRTMPNDSIDSVWVQLATEASEFGWTRESELLPKVVPDDPISQFISTFSDQHVHYALIVILLLAVVLLFRKAVLPTFRPDGKENTPYIVHFNDIDSFYPTLLTLIVASAATFYASLQMFAPQLWQQFYYHPTLNPFSVPGLLSVFLVSVWAMLIIAVAVVDVVRKQLPLGEALVYLGGLTAVCAVDYIVFSLTTLWYIGYLLLAVYIAFAVHQYYKYHRYRYVCGNCGKKLRNLGKCPHCGAINEE